MIVKIDVYREIKSGLSPYLFLTHVQTQVGVRKLAHSLVHMHVYIGKGKFVSSPLECQSAPHFTSLADLFNQAPSQLG